MIYFGQFLGTNGALKSSYAPSWFSKVGFQLARYSETILKSLSLLFTRLHFFPRNTFGHHPLSFKMLPNKDYNLIYLGEVWNKGCKTVSRNTPNFGNGAFQKDFLVKQQPSNTSDQQIRLRIDSWWCPSRTPDGVTVTYGGLSIRKQQLDGFWM